jgi:two-component system, chemotaxis family, sensor kinase Cph1
MIEYFRNLFNHSDFVPRPACGGWTSGLIYLHNASDALIWLSYMAIPIILIYFIRKHKDWPFQHVFWLFGAFIVTCGFTHFLDILTFYVPHYRLSGLLKLITALASAGTVVALIPTIPKALSLRTPQELEREIEQRKRAEAEIRQLNQELEQRVQERTAELEAQIIERKKTEKALEAHAKELARSNEELEQFAYVASHDLREPLRMVSSYVQLLEQRYQDKLDKDANEFIHFAVDGAERMQTLISDLLSFSRVGTRGNPFQPTNVQDLLDQVCTDLQFVISDHQAQIIYQSLPTIMADKTQLTQVFQNLISNAIKFRSDEQPLIQINVQQQDNNWLFTITDNGIGIDPTFSERIFVIFQRLHTRDQYPGTGIGLAICKKIIERHGGHIWFEPNHPQGTQFLFTLPNRSEK